MVETERFKTSCKYIWQLKTNMNKKLKSKNGLSVAAHSVVVLFATWMLDCQLVHVV